MDFQGLYNFFYSHIKHGDYSLSFFVMLIGLIFILKLVWWTSTTLLQSTLCKLVSFVYKTNLRKYGEWAVVTGSTDGIGKAYAIELAKRKMNIVLISRSVQKLEDTAAEIRKAANGVEVKTIQADFTHGFQVFENIERELKSLDVGILVNNVGIAPPHPTFRKVEDTDKQHLYNELLVNNGAPSQLVRMILPQMKQKKRGMIMFVGSIVEEFYCPYFTNYSATKAFVLHYATSLRREVSHHNIDVHILEPSITETNLAAGDHLFNKLPGALRSFGYPSASTYASWAICTLGWCNVAPGYWFFDLSMFVVKLLENLGLVGTVGIWLIRFSYGNNIN